MIFRKFRSLGSVVLAGLFLTACATGNCKQVSKADTQTGAAVTTTPADQKSKTVKQNKSTTQADRVTIYKYDGSLQCGMGKGLSAEEMEKELKGIKVYSRTKKPDGLMHIQVCGAPTGMINVYEIAPADLEKAEKRGFKKWDLE